MNDERLTNLEIKFSHQDMMLEQLNKIVTSQQTTIERMEKEILDLKRNINQENGVQGSRSLADDRPPHY
jgi:SlyX protein